MAASSDHQKKIMYRALESFLAATKQLFENPPDEHSQYLGIGGVSDPFVEEASVVES